MSALNATNRGFHGFERDLKKRVCLISLGCPKNLVDAELMLGALKQDGFGFTSQPEEAEVIVGTPVGFVADSKERIHRTDLRGGSPQKRPGVVRSWSPRAA
jgi:tRNA A37 methylthiotransferase MiaB